MGDHIAHPFNGAPLDTIAGLFPLCLRKGAAKLSNLQDRKSNASLIISIAVKNLKIISIS